MRAQPNIRADILGKLLLVQETLDVLPDSASIAKFLRRSLVEVPGVVDSHLYVGGEVFPPSREFAEIGARCEAAWKASGTCPDDMIGAVRVICLPLRTARRLYGMSLLSLDDEEAFSPYRAFVRNLDNVVATTFETRDHIRQLDAARVGLETMVAERTATLKESQEKFRALVETSSDWVWEVDAGGTFTYSSPKVEELLGFTPEEVIGRTPFDFMLPEERQRIAPVFLEASLAARPLEQVVNTNLHKDGHEVVMETSGSPIFDAAGKVAGYRGIDRDVTARQRAEQALRDSENKFRQVSASAPDAIILLDQDGEITDWNAAAERTFGYEAAEVIGRDLHSLVVPGRQQGTFREGLRQFRDTGAGPVINKTLEMAALRRDGTEFPVELSISPVLLRGEWHAIGIVRDVSERQRAEDALRHSEASLRQAQRIGHTGSWELDLASNVLTWTDEVYRIFELDPRDTCASYETFLNAIHPDDRERVDKAYTESVKNRVPYEIEHRLLMKDGRVKFVQERCETSYDDDGRAVLSIGTVQDITERKMAQEELRKLSQAVEQSQSNIVITDLQPSIEYVNESFLRQTGYSRNEVLGQNPRILQSGNTPRETYRELWTALTNGDTWTGEFHNRRKDGSEYVELAVISPVRQSDGVITHYVSMKEDITERKRLTRELERHRDHLVELVDERTRELVEAREQAEAANRAKSAFLATMSHEIRTPLNGVIAMAEMLALRPLDPKDLDFARTIDRSAHLLLSIINNILDLSKIEAGKLELELADMSLREVADDLSASLHPVAASGDVDLSIAVAPDVPPYVRGDETRVRQILMNLTGNAIKFSRGRADMRGQVSVRVEVTSELPLRVGFHITDNGVGMAPDTLSQLFTPFMQAETSTTRRFGGTGLGLTICQRLVDLMEGTIGVTSVVGHGSTFTVTLPFQVSETPREAATSGAGAARDAMRPAPAAWLTEAEARAQGRLILVAEDDEINQKVIRQQLALLGHAGEIAGDGLEALQLWRHGRYAMLLSDLHMPNMDGYELAAAIRAEEPTGRHLPIIALTADALRGEADRAMSVGMDGYLTKPVPLAKLRDLLDKWIVPAASTAASASTND
ncbi:MAG: PAS domain-containing hybrid sensor histidine kinase/response regulator [Gemmatimonadaceae bacterium]